ncbi:MAG: MFS transporter [Glutamicibacter arilaitensis]|uniref:MFS transporter n=1 Tax=Glutamicibacter arilaitensis TaxID=256701 RepID=UPI003FB9B601
MSTPALKKTTVAPLYAAGFTTAFGAHSIAAGLGSEFGSLGTSLLTLGILLAVYDLAEVILKPIFGTLSDRIGSKPIIIGGLIVFTLMSSIGIFAQTPLALGLVRLGQGAAASAFSPAASAAVARMSGKNTGRYFGRYGAWKTLGYVTGPLLGALLIHFGGFPALFAAMAVISLVASLWVWRSMPALPVLPKTRYTFKDLARQTMEPGFLMPTLVLAAATGALGTAVGFLPLLGTELGLDNGLSMGIVSVLALSSAVIQPWAGKLKDEALISSRAGMVGGLLLIAAGLSVAAAWPSTSALFACAVLAGLGIGIATPLGFAHLAASTAPERLRRAMGSAELGREMGDAGGPLLVGSIAAAASLATGLWVLSVLVVVIAALAFAFLRRRRT